MAKHGLPSPSSTDETPLDEAPEDFLRRFFLTMNRWETEAAQRFKAAATGPHQLDPVLYDSARRAVVDDLRRIFAEFCGAATPKRGNSFSDPSAYDVEGEIIQGVLPKGKKVRIFTQQTTTGYNNRLVYTLTRNGTSWKLLDNRVRVESDGTEESWPL
jgi:hypothetical protein